jgi:GntR family transcriptional repressor for pyruvate dehydrogenase complex
VELVFDEMKKAIRGGEWQIGSKIPSESELAQIYGVNRLTVRLALQRLSTMGLIETKVGEGSYVRQFKFSHYIDQAMEFDMTDEMLDSVCEFRKHLEIECARLAITRSTEEEKNHLRDLLESVTDDRLDEADDTSIQNYVDSYVEADLNFHYQVCLMSHNILYIRAFEMAKPVIKQYLRALINKRFHLLLGKKKKMGDFNRLHYRIHFIIYESIITGNFSTCEQSYIDMVDFNVDITG